MEIKNELITLKIGKKKYDFKNLILNEYFSRFILKQTNQTIASYIPHSTKLDCLFFKFDTAFENLSGNSELYVTDFDIFFESRAKVILQEISEQTITVKYTYAIDDSIYDYNTQTGNGNPLSKYNGKKITAIGFGAGYFSKYKICAVLDTSNYNIYMQSNQKIECTRKDVISTDAIFRCSDKRVKGPVHLCPNGGEPLLDQDPYLGYKDEDKIPFMALQPQRTKAVLYSIGLSSYLDYIDKELVLGINTQITYTNTEIEFNTIDNNYSLEKELYPSEIRFPSANLYLTKSCYKYIFFKYKIYQSIQKASYDKDGNRSTVDTQTDTDVYYYQIVPIDKFGKSNFKIKYERR